MDIVISHFNFNIKHRNKCKYALKLFPMVTTLNIFSLEVVQKLSLSTLCITGKLYQGDNTVTSHNSVQPRLGYISSSLPINSSVLAET